jgi:hypothetical protein
LYYSAAIGLNTGDFNWFSEPIIWSNKSMSRSIPFIISLALVAASTSTWANEEEIRSNCEYDVQAYGIADENEYKQALQDCIDSYMQDIRDSEQGDAENQQEADPNQ